MLPAYGTLSYLVLQGRRPEGIAPEPHTTYKKKISNHNQGTDSETILPRFRHL